MTEHNEVKMIKTIKRCGMGSLFNKWNWKNCVPICKRVKLDPYFTPYIKIKSKWIQDQNKT